MSEKNLELATEKNKEFALAELKKRQENQPIKKNNAMLPAGSSMYFYCNSCGHLADILPETYVTQPKTLCDECQSLKDSGWLKK